MRLRGKSSSLDTGRTAPNPYKTAAERAYYELKRRILTCRLSAGSPVLEKKLSAEIGVSPEMLVDACCRLERERLVCREKSKEFLVTPFSLADIRELCELRRIVESRSAALAAERARRGEIARLLAVAELRYQPGERCTYLQYLTNNSAFHVQLAHASRNSRLESAVVSVLDQIQRPMYLGLDVGLDQDAATAEHLQIVDAVRRKRPVLASRLMWDQLTSAEKRMIEAYGDNGIA